MLYVEKYNLQSDTVFWCGHRAGNGAVSQDDKVIMMAGGAIVITCQACWIALGKTILKSGVYLAGDGGPVSFWCKHREFENGAGLPAVGDMDIEIIKNNEDALLVGCPGCSEQLIEKLAEKAIRMKFENVEILEDIIRGD